MAYAVTALDALDRHHDRLERMPGDGEGPGASKNLVAKDFASFLHSEGSIDHMS